MNVPLAVFCRPRGVGKERVTPGGGVFIAGSIKTQGIQTDGRVDNALGVAFERSVTDCRVEVTGGVTEERLMNRRPCSPRKREQRYSSRAFENRRPCGDRRLCWPPRATAPLAVLPLPLVLLKSDQKPVAVLNFPVLIMSA